MKLALVFCRSPFRSNVYHHYLPPHSDWDVLGPVVEPEPEPEPEPEFTFEPAVGLVVALVAANRTADVYIIVATPAVEKRKNKKSLPR